MSERFSDLESQLGCELPEQENLVFWKLDSVQEGREWWSMRVYCDLNQAVKWGKRGEQGRQKCSVTGQCEEKKKDYELKYKKEQRV